MPLRDVTLVYIGAMIVNTTIALHYRWPAMFDAPGNPETITTDFIFHGRRISPPVHALIILTAAALFIKVNGRRGVVSILLLVAFSTLGVVAAAGEPSILPDNNVPRVIWEFLGAVGRYALLLIIALGIAGLVRRSATLVRRSDRRSA